MITKLLRVLRPHDVKLRDETWHDNLGHELVTVRRRARVLHDAGLASTYDCGGDQCGERRRVISAPGEVPGKPYLALCAIDNGCLDLPLAEDELRLSTLSFAGACDVLRAALRIEADGPVTVAAPDVFLLGSLVRGGLRADAFLALNPDLESFPYFLTARGTAQRLSVAFVNTKRWLPQTIVDLHGPGRRVEIVLLEDVLGLVNGVVVGAEPEPAPVVSTPVATAISHDGERMLTEEDYLSLDREAARMFDLYLDAATLRTLGRKKFFRGGYRDAGGAFHESKLTFNEGRAVAEFVELARDRALAPSKLPTVADKNADQLFKTGWPKVDPARRALRPEGSGARFAPPPGVRWALIKPVAR